MHTPARPDSNGKRACSLLTRFLVIAVALATFAPRAAFAGGERDTPFVYVGTYTAPGTAPGGLRPSTAVGIYVFRMQPHDGDLSLVQVVPASNPSFLALDPSLRRLYSVNEDLAGRVSAFSVDQANGRLTFLNSASSNGQHPTHITVHPSGQYVIAANYSSGNYPVFRVAPGGALGPMTDDFHGVGNGTGPNAARQEAPHAHQILSDLDARHLFGVDLGADRVNVLNLDLGTGKVTPNEVPFANVASGGGPRHMVFAPNRRHAYVLNELVSSVDAFAYDPVRGAFTWLQTVATLPRGFTGFNTTAEIRITPDGRFLYNTNRGHNSVTMYEVDQNTGKVELIGWESTRGEWPRGMNVDPTGRFLYVGNQNTDNIAVFRIHRRSGRLSLSAVVRTPTPVDIEFGP